MNKYTEILPAGAVYFQAKPTSVSAEKFPSENEAIEMAVEKIERSGAILKDEDVIRAMDSGLSGKIVKAKVDSNGNLKEIQKSTSLLTLEEFGQLEKEVEEVIGKIGERIVSGEANADPMLIGGKSPCDWCENRFVCRNVRN